MAHSERTPPVTFQAVAPRIVGTGVKHVVARRLVRQPALVAHGLDHALAVLADHHRCVGTWENAVVARQQLHPMQVFQPGLCALDAVAGHAQVVARFLRGPGGQRGMGNIASFALPGQFGLQGLLLLRMPLLDLRHDVPPLFGTRTGESVIHRLRSLRPFLARIVCVQFGEVLQRQDGAELAYQFGVVSADQGGIAHGTLWAWVAAAATWMRQDSPTHPEMPHE